VKQEPPKLKFDFEALNRHAIENTRRSVAESAPAPEHRGRFAKKRGHRKTEPEARLPELDDEALAADDTEEWRREPRDSGYPFEQIAGAAERDGAAKRPRRWLGRKREADHPAESATDET
jgi:hypothetical protein